MRRRTTLLGVVIALGVTASMAEAQAVRVEGRVADNVSGASIGYADLTVRRPGGRFVRTVQADSAGRFDFQVQGLRGVELQVGGLGYEPNTTPVLYFDDKRYIEVEIRLEADAVLLAPLEVLVWSAVGSSSFLDSYRRRLRTGMGIYITRAEIEARNPSFISDMLRTVPGMQVGSSGSGLRSSLSFGRSLAMRCYPQIFVDGMLMNPPTVGEAGARIDDLVNPATVEGIEIYRGLSTIPPEFLTPEAECGVIAVWTRRGPIG